MNLVEWLRWWYNFHHREIHDTAGDLFILAIFTVVMLCILGAMHKLYIYAGAIK